MTPSLEPDTVSARATLSSCCDRSAGIMDGTRAHPNGRPSRRLRRRAGATLMVVTTLHLASSRQLLLPLALVSRARPFPLRLLFLILGPLPTLFLRLGPPTRLDLFRLFVSEPVQVLINFICLQRRGRKRKSPAIGMAPSPMTVPVVCNYLYRIYTGTYPISANLLPRLPGSPPARFVQLRRWLKPGAR